MGTAGMTPEFPSNPQAIALSEGQRIINTFADPPKTFTDLRPSRVGGFPGYWVPLLPRPSFLPWTRKSVLKPSQRIKWRMLAVLLNARWND